MSTSIDIPANLSTWQGETPSELSSPKWLTAFVCAVFLFQVSLFFIGDIGAIRVPLRVATYCLSLAGLFLVSGRGTVHPVARLMYVAAAILAMGFLNPNGDSLLARLGQCGLYLAILAPCLWVSRIRVDQRAFTILVRLLWSFYLISALFGVLQVKYPGQFDGAISANIEMTKVKALTFELADGSKVISPKGLTDNPGGAGSGGIYTIVLGIGILLADRNLLFRIGAAFGMFVGLFCIYVCQGRTSLIIVLFDAVVVLFVLLRRRAIVKASILGGFLVVVAIAGSLIAFSVGGKSTVDRYLTLLADDPSTVFQRNRGHFLDQLIYEDSFLFPLGAGEGRWGLMNIYFGDTSNSLWAEMQWQALLYDGGLPLIATYIAIFGTLLWTSYKIAVSATSEHMAFWAAAVLGYTFSALVASFAFPIMCMQLGVELMLLNACLYAYFIQSQVSLAEVNI